MRQFVSETEPDSKGCIAVSGKNFHYLHSVLRVESGDMMHVRLPDGTLQQMTVAKVDGSSKSIVLTVAGERGRNEGLWPSLWLFQFIAKPPKMELIIRQAVECGVSVIVPVIGEFCQGGCIESARKHCEPQDTRWRRIITEARQQSGSAVDTRILPCATVGEACSLWQRQSDAVLGQGAFAGGSFAAVLYEQSDNTVPFHEAVGRALESFQLESCRSLAAAAVMVGAEGGISPEELELARGSGFVPVHLKTNILRCETAALYGMAVLQNAITESDVWQLKK